MEIGDQGKTAQVNGMREFSKYMQKKIEFYINNPDVANEETPIRPVDDVVTDIEKVFDQQSLTLVLNQSEKLPQQSFHYKHPEESLMSKLWNCCGCVNCFN